MNQLLWTFLFMAAAVKALAGDPFSFRDSGSGSLELSEGGKLVFVYNYGMKLKEGVPESRRRSTYLHPVCAPDGTVLTDDFPADHHHHRGISWMWPVVIMEGRRYDLWEIRGIHQRFVRWTQRETADNLARLGVENGWYAEGRKVLRESVEIVTQRASAGRRSLDFKLSFEPIESAIEIAGTPAQQKGYGGLCFRFAPRGETVLTTDAGREKEDTNLAPHRWAQLEGEYQGRRAGARIEIDPSNPGFPNGWCLRYYGFLGVSFPGLTPYTLRPGRPLVLKYRVTLFSTP